MFVPESRAELRVGIAVSGGADSVCLLHALRELAPRWNLHLSVVHVEHGIRGEASREDARFVEETASVLGLPFHLLAADVPALAAAEGDNLEQTARRVRLGFFHGLIEKGIVDRVATGHTRTDQAETLLWRIVRGTGWTGLGGIFPVTAEGLVRPLIEADREQVLAFLRERGLSWREDDTNAELHYSRNRIRRQVMPLLRELNPEADRAFANLAEIARDEEAFWEEHVPEMAVQDGVLVLPRKQLNSAPRALARRRARRAIQAIKGDLRQIGLAHIEAILDLASASEGSGRLQIPDVDVFRSFDWVRFARFGHDSGRERDYSFATWPPADLLLPGEQRLSLEVIETYSLENNCVTVKEDLDWWKVEALQSGASCRLEVRNWRPGDVLRLPGHAEQKIKALFQQARIPLWQRRHWPVLERGGKIVWTKEFGPDAAFAADSQSRTVLRARSIETVR